ncbi:hypothetical protein BvCmsHHP056_03119 [Escherichia coli]|nr:hypothetical protein BvCmsHHP056_03119 [Escherichia coli]
MNPGKPCINYPPLIFFFGFFCIHSSDLQPVPPSRIRCTVGTYPVKRLTLIYIMRVFIYSKINTGIPVLFHTVLQKCRLYGYHTFVTCCIIKQISLPVIHTSCHHLHLPVIFFPAPPYTIKIFIKKPFSDIAVQPPPGSNFCSDFTQTSPYISLSQFQSGFMFFWFTGIPPGFVFQFSFRHTIQRRLSGNLNS